MHRRRFLKFALAAGSSSALLISCASKSNIKGSIIGASAARGHMLRDKTFADPVKILSKNVVIVGAGISGLSAARNLFKNGVQDFVILDLEDEPGGNSRYGSNSVSEYPWGAHYIPTPNNDLPEYLDFLKETNVVTSFNESGLPVYNEEYLCFDPQERLYINGRWQDGLVPHYGLPEDDLKQVNSFIKMMDVFRDEKGSDGKFIFSIPVDESTKDITELDSVTMKTWMIENSFTSDYLHWYINYCTRDDFGTSYDQVSAWIGIHYFASRRGIGANANHSDVLTWPEGNGFLVKQLTAGITDKMQLGNVALNVIFNDNGVLVKYYDSRKKVVNAIQCKQCILATPQFVTARLLADDDRMKKVHENYYYTPWMVANIAVSRLEERSGAPLSWDNVIYGSSSLGYVEATHELLSQTSSRKNLTYYLPLTEGTVADARKAAQERTHEQWVKIIIDDLKKVHPNIEEAIQEVNVMIWGHAMAQPLPGMVHGSLRAELSTSIKNKIHFAHSDLAGCSIFEEAFYQGLKASEKVLSSMGIG